jgi:hypothetical protein
MPQAPALQEAVPLLELQAAPQPPQLAALVSKFASHPLARALPSQSANGAVHTMLHVPLEQVAVPLAAEQALPHPPQFWRFVFVFTSQPFVRALPSQFANGGLQVMAQLPPLHVAVPFALEQAWLQPPQWLTLILVSISQPFVRALPSQFAKPVAQAMLH